MAGTDGLAVELPLEQGEGCQQRFAVLLRLTPDARAALLQAHAVGGEATLSFLPGLASGVRTRGHAPHILAVLLFTYRNPQGVALHAYGTHASHPINAA
jgi:hypothetical protein